MRGDVLQSVLAFVALGGTGEAKDAHRDLGVARSITLNTKDAADREKFDALAREADVYIQNFRPGFAEQIGAGVVRRQADERPARRRVGQRLFIAGAASRKQPQPNKPRQKGHQHGPRR